MFENTPSFRMLTETRSLFTVKLCSVDVFSLRKKLNFSLCTFCEFSFQITVIYITIINSSVLYIVLQQTNKHLTALHIKSM